MPVALGAWGRLGGAAHGGGAEAGAVGPGLGRWARLVPPLREPQPRIGYGPVAGQFTLADAQTEKAPAHAD